MRLQESCHEAYASKLNMAVEWSREKVEIYGRQSLYYTIQLFQDIMIVVRRNAVAEIVEALQINSELAC